MGKQAVGVTMTVIRLFWAIHKWALVKMMRIISAVLFLILNEMLLPYAHFITSAGSNYEEGIHTGL